MSSITRTVPRFIKIKLDTGITLLNPSHFSSIYVQENKIYFQYERQSIDSSFLLGSGAFRTYNEPYVLTYRTKENAQSAMLEIEKQLQ